MAHELTPAEVSLLGLLAERPRHGYEIEEVIVQRGMREWTEIGFSSIYYLLGRLRDRGLAEEVERHRGARGRQRKVYAPTETGAQALAAAAEEALAELRPEFPPLLVGLANLPAVPAERRRVALQRRAESLAERIAAVRAAADRDGQAPPFVRAIFAHALSRLTAEQQWLAEHREVLCGDTFEGDTRS
jgi:DNA-binding PadR family transcriptional regulator